jgi:hypothetical protein
MNLNWRGIKMRGRHSKQPASLWEVVNKNRLRQSQEKAIGQIAHEQKRSEKVETGRADGDSVLKKAGSVLNVPAYRYVLLIAALAVIIVLLFVFHLGQRSAKQEATVEQLSPAVKVVTEVKPATREVRTFSPLQNVESDKVVPEVATPVKPSATAVTVEKSHVIVIASYNVAKDLEPVKKYFAQKGIETEIKKPKASIFYMLVTKNRYESPSRKGSDGYYALEKIKKAGAQYKAPKGYEPFGGTPFQDAYGLNIVKSDLF